MYFDVVVLCKCECIVDGVGDVGEQCVYFFGGFEVLLVVVVVWMFGVVEYVVGGDVYMGFVCVEIFWLQEVYVVVGYYGQVVLVGGLKGELVECFFVFVFGMGQFQVQVIVEYVLLVGELLFGEVVVVFIGKVFGQVVVVGQGEQVVVVGFELVWVYGDVVFWVVVFYLGVGQQVREIQVVFVIVVKQGYVLRGYVFFGDYDVGIGDWFDVDGFGCFVEFDQCEQVVQVGDCQCWQFQFYCVVEQVGLFGFFWVGLIWFCWDMNG